MTPQQITLGNIRSIKIRFAYRFLRSLNNLNRRRLTSDRRSYMVKFASYASMASAVGSRKLWSRAMLRKIRNKGLIIPSLLKPSCKTRSLSTRTIDIQNPSTQSTGFFEGAEEVRRLVPGGESMDFCNLLDETAHYIKCLNSQVQIMKNILDFYSA